MAGGIFADQPFYFNPKCVVISVILMVLYWILPYRNPFMLPVIFLVGYIAIAWYDYLYNCDLQMYSGTFPISMATLDAWGKPQRRFEKSDNKLVEKQELIYKKKVYALHALFIAPLLFYVGWNGKKSNKYIWSVIGSVSFLAFLYHGLRILYPRDITTCIKENEEERRTLLFVYIMHVMVIAPLLTYIAYYNVNSNTKVYNPLVWLSVFLFLYTGTRYFFPREVEENC